MFYSYWLLYHAYFFPATNHQGKNCKSSLEGVYQFGYRLSHLTTSECFNTNSRIFACQKPGNQFSIVNQQFDMSYKSCDGKNEDRDIQYKCLGDWYIGKNHYFAVANTRESRMSEIFRCFVRIPIQNILCSIS